jgi:hypothetical protein
VKREIKNGNWDGRINYEVRLDQNSKDDDNAMLLRRQSLSLYPYDRLIEDTPSISEDPL